MATKKPLAVYSGKIKELQSGDAVSYDQIGGLATARLVGRSTAGTGALEAISIGSGLSLSAGTLSATGGEIADQLLPQYNPAASKTVPAGYGLYIPGGRYEITTGTSLEIAATGVMEIG